MLAAMQGGLIGRLSRRFGEARLVTAGAASIVLGPRWACRSRVRSWRCAVVDRLLASGMGMLNPRVNSLDLAPGRHRRARRHSRRRRNRRAASRAPRRPPVAGVLFTLAGHDAPYYRRRRAHGAGGGDGAGSRVLPWTRRRRARCCRHEGRTRRPPRSATSRPKSGSAPGAEGGPRPLPLSLARRLVELRVRVLLVVPIPRRGKARQCLSCRSFTRARSMR